MVQRCFQKRKSMSHCLEAFLLAHLLWHCLKWKKHWTTTAESREWKAFLTGVMKLRVATKNRAVIPQSPQGEGGRCMKGKAGMMVNHRARHAARGWGQAAQHHRGRKGLPTNIVISYGNDKPCMYPQKGCGCPYYTLHSPVSQLCFLNPVSSSSGPSWLRGEWNSTIEFICLG